MKKQQRRQQDDLAAAQTASRSVIGAYVEEPIEYGKAPPPNQLKPGVMWVMRDEDGTVCAVDFLCPCNCGSECYTPVTDATKGQPKTERHWLFSYGPTGGVTLSPSIRYTGGCRAHFHVEDGKTKMCSDSGK